MGKNMAIQLNPCCYSANTVDFKLLFRAEIISSNSAGFLKAKLCQGPILVLTLFYWGVYSKHLAKQRKGVSHFPSSETAMQTHQPQHGRAPVEAAG